MTRGRIAGALLAATMVSGASGPAQPPRKASAAHLAIALPATKVVGLEAQQAWHGDAGRYAGPTLVIAKDAQEVIKLGPAEALVQADALAARHPAKIAERRYLAALFAAAAEPYSAVV